MDPKTIIGITIAIALWQVFGRFLLDALVRNGKLRGQYQAGDVLRVNYQGFAGFLVVLIPDLPPFKVVNVALLQDPRTLPTMRANLNLEVTIDLFPNKDAGASKSRAVVVTPTHLMLHRSCLQESSVIGRISDLSSLNARMETIISEAGKISLQIQEGKLAAPAEHIAYFRVFREPMEMAVHNHVLLADPFRVSFLTVAVGSGMAALFALDSELSLPLATLSWLSLLAFIFTRPKF